MSDQDQGVQLPAPDQPAEVPSAAAEPEAPYTPMETPPPAPSAAGPGASGPESPQPPGPDASLGEQKPAKHGVPPWVWIVATILVVVAALAWYQTTQTAQGRLWLLGLRGQTQVPIVVGQTQTQAQATLEAAGLRLGQVSQEQTLAVPPGVVTTQTPAPGQAAKKDSGVNVAVAAIPTVQLPNVVGQTQSDAVTTLAEQGLRAGVITYVYSSSAKAGYVTAQTPAASTEVTVGSAVGLSVSKGTQQGQVPNVIGLSQDDANSVITSAGFKVTTVKATSTSVSAGNVSAQSPGAGGVAPTGSTVTITVSTGAPTPPPSTTPSTPSSPSSPTSPTAPPSNAGQPSQLPSTPTKPPSTKPVAQVPDVVGLGVLDAVTTLKKAQLKVSFSFAPSPGDFLKVTEQDPNAGASVDPGTTVTITIGLPSLSLPGGLPTTPTPLPAQKPAATPQPAPAPVVPTSTPVPAPSVPST